MATVGLVEARWENFIGAPGFSRFTFEAPSSVADATTATNKVRSFFQALVTLIPNGVTVQVQQAVPLYDEQTGVLFGELSATTVPPIVTGTALGGAPVAGGAGAMIGWKTESIWQGRRVQGRTFLVPLAGVSEANGTLAAAAITTITTAGDGLIAPSTPAFGVWAKQHVRQGTPPKPVQTNGSFFLATSVSVPDRTGILRSRRD